MTSSDAPNDVHTFSLVTADRPGVLVRIALVFSRRGYNIESLAVSPAATGGFARMTITSRGNPEILEQIIKQLAKLIDVVYITDHHGHAPVEVEVALVKVVAANGTASEVQRVAEQHGAIVVDTSEQNVVVRVCGPGDAIGECIASLEHFGLEEIVRSGSIVMDRGRSQFAHMLKH